VHRGNRPLSPHIQIYRPQLTSVLSILHRFSGMLLAAATLLLTYWVLSVANGAEAYAGAQAFLGSWFGRVILFACSLSLFYHLCNGVRHLFWDAGLGLELETAYASGKAVVGASVALTLLAWIIGYMARGSGA